MADAYLVITDGTTTVTLLDGSGGNTNYRVASGRWAPNVARLRESTLAGHGPYENVDEEITLHISDTTAAGCYTRVDTLTRLIEQARRWYLGENVSAVLVKFSPPSATVSSSGTPLQAAILGGSVTLSPDIEFTGTVPFIRNVVLRFRRRGQWLLSTTTDDSSSTSNGSLAVCDLTAAISNIGPTKVGFTNYVSSASDSGFMLVSSNDGGDRVAIVDPTGATTTNWTTSNESANFAPYTSVLRYTPAATTESTSGQATISLSSGTLYAVFASIRNNSSSTSFRVRATMSSTTGETILPYTYIAPYSGAAQPQWYFLGLTPYCTFIELMATADAVAGSIDFGAIAAIDVSYKGSAVIAFKPTTVDAITKGVGIDHRLLTKPTPGNSGDPFDIKGDMVIQTLARNIICLVLMCGASDDWRQTSAGAVTANIWTATRYSAYITPV